ncbi:hypothetical protein OZX58_00300 [Lactobacillus sp. ESL0680]|uniref:hypothetical protein n=1 Tax=Lactobacillus sp. ESL0680 TaxID=2983210 RepID=UPI0023F7A23F|nr:hypothetical protein [Lactobacillus sp. ESL0680]WEV38747.1 hypothetical protein OZX58_00300 [Lactobacillus sp. ESL0680]
MKSKLQRLLIVLCSIVMLIQPITYITSNTVIATTTQKEKISTAKKDLKLQVKLSDKDLKLISNKNILALDKQINEVRPRGFVSDVKLCVKAVRVAYKLLPKKVQKKILKYGITKTAKLIVKVVDKYSGYSSKLVHTICKKIHIPRKYANILAKVVNFFL